MTYSRLKHLFRNDDGSLPDIFVENLSRHELRAIYAWVRGIARVYGDSLVWDKRHKVDLPIKGLSECPVEMFLEGSFDSFRHGLEPFTFGGVLIPQLTICIESESSISFDYKMGSDWAEPEVLALFGFLMAIREIAPTCRVFQANEGGIQNAEFEHEFNLLVAGNT